MRILVQKFGGTSVADLSAMKNVLRNVLRATEQGYKVVAVLSAMAGETNRLLGLAQQWSPNALASEQDVLLATGEQVSTALFSILAHDAGLRVRSLTAMQIPLYTSADYTCARIESIETDNIYEAFSAYDVLVVTGFQGITRNGRITTLGRGGSDTTAVAIAAALDSAPCEIYTDVEGVYTTDPNMCFSARKRDFISYDEMLEMASMGAKVLQIRSVLFAKRYNVPLYVRSTFSDNEGTFLLREEDIMESTPVSGIAYDRAQAMVALHGVSVSALQIVLRNIAIKNIIVDMIVQSTTSVGIDVTFSIAKKDAPITHEVVEALQSEIGNPVLHYEDNLAKVSVIGFGMRDHAGVAVTVFETLANEGIPIVLVNTSEIKISCLIPEKYLELAVRSLHDAFELEKE